MNFDSPKNNIESTQEGQKAVEKIETFLHKIDPNLVVSVEYLKGTLHSDPGNSEYRNVLLFQDAVKGVKWTMDINEDEGYLEQGIEDSVRTVYEKELKKLTEAKE